MSTADMCFPLLVLDTRAGILDQYCYAWNKRIDQPWRIITIGMRDWTYRFKLPKIDVSTPIGVRAPRRFTNHSLSAYPSYGSGAALPALAAIGEDGSDPQIRHARDWLIDRQQADGGRGESCASYMRPELAGRGDATASQTSWALMTLLAVGRPQDRVAIDRGCCYLIERQIDGTWTETHGD